MSLRQLILACAALAAAGCASTPAPVAATAQPDRAATPEPSQAAPTCDVLRVSIADGTLNGLKPTLTMTAAKKFLPCATGDTEEGGPFNCGGGVFFIKHQMFAYTHRDYFEIRDGFPGTFDTPLLGRTLDEVKELLGEPDRTVPSRDWQFAIYDRPWGALRLNVGTDGKVAVVGLHTGKAADVKLCL